MKQRILLLGTFLILAIMTTNCQDNSKYKTLSADEELVIVNKGTERPFTGIYNDFTEEGTYNCKRCGAELYKSDAKFDGHCGWPSFDDEIAGSVKRILDADGRRTEIVCSNCGAHLGHLFEGERFTDKNTRHCVNSISLTFTAFKMPEKNFDTAYFASGCFWGTQFHFQKKEGVISTEVGYMGGHRENPTYEQVCTGNTGHAETTKVIFDSKKISYDDLAKLFFETHDQGQINRQGPDIGTQYRSVIFYTSESEKKIAEKLMEKLRKKGFKVATELTPTGTFWIAEDHHQNYYHNIGGSPYCHIYQKKF